MHPQGRGAGRRRPGGRGRGGRRGGQGGAACRPPTLEELASDGMAPFRKKVVARAIKPEALRRLREGMAELYEYERGGDRIVLDGEAVRYTGLAGAALKAGRAA